MPRYDYACKECGQVFETKHGFDETREGEQCPSGQCGREDCDGRLTRLIVPPAVHYKGYGFYTTDRRDATEKYAFEHFDGSGRNPELKAMQRRIKDPGSTLPGKKD